MLMAPKFKLTKTTYFFLSRFNNLSLAVRNGKMGSIPRRAHRFGTNAAISRVLRQVHNSCAWLSLNSTAGTPPSWRSHGADFNPVGTVVEKKSARDRLEFGGQML